MLHGDDLFFSKSGGNRRLAFVVPKNLSKRNVFQLSLFFAFSRFLTKKQTPRRTQRKNDLFYLQIHLCHSLPFFGSCAVPKNISNRNVFWLVPLFFRSTFLLDRLLFVFGRPWVPLGSPLGHPWRPTWTPWSLLWSALARVGGVLVAKCVWRLWGCFFLIRVSALCPAHRLALIVYKTPLIMPLVFGSRRAVSLRFCS